MPAQDDMFLHFRTDHLKNPPIPITCMHIALDFSKATRNRGGIFGSTFTAPLSGMVQARPASRDAWLSWLQFGSGAVIEEMSPYREDQVLEVLDVLRRRVNLKYRSKSETAIMKKRRILARAKSPLQVNPNWNFGNGATGPVAAQKHL